MRVWCRARFDHLVDKAGAGLFATVDQVTPEMFDNLLVTHLKGSFFLDRGLRWGPDLRGETW